MSVRGLHRDLRAVTGTSPMKWLLHSPAPPGAGGASSLKTSSVELYPPGLSRWSSSRQRRRPCTLDTVKG
ncbi:MULTISPECIES: hypothetical protein [unclassified Nonomuraea]|uniref:hypothetical protein n=1 Tax=unclassified Nonomuraea TaxID=2593643 RepID=UPI0033E70368